MVRCHFQLREYPVLMDVVSRRIVLMIAYFKVCVTILSRNSISVVTAFEELQ